MQHAGIRIVGLGSAGCNVADRLFERVTHPASLAAVHTDAHTLETCRAAVKIQIGERLTQGFGTGGDMEKGCQAAMEEIDVLRALFSDVRLAIVVTGLGGGTGSGAGTALIEAAREEGALTLCFVTLPFAFEGAERMRQARETLDIWSRMADAILVTPNDRLMAFVHEPGLANAFDKANDTLASAIGAIEKMIVQPGLIQLDFGDIRFMLGQTGGAGTFGYGEGSGPDKAREAARHLIESPLLEEPRALVHAKRVLLSIVAGEDLTLKEVSDITQALSRELGPTGKLRVGTAIDPRLAARVELALILPFAPESPRPSTQPARDEKDEPASGSARMRQTSLKLEVEGKGRFKDVEPTVQDGQDLDIPTFIRRKIAIRRE
jgi:cell division protein FtsZ